MITCETITMKFQDIFVVPEGGGGFYQVAGVGSSFVLNGLQSYFPSMYTQTLST